MNPDRDSSSCADVQEGATAGSDKATPKACSTGRGAPGPGLGGTPTSVWEYPKRIFSYIARLFHENPGNPLYRKRFLQPCVLPPQGVLSVENSDKNEGRC